MHCLQGTGDLCLRLLAGEGSSRGQAGAVAAAARELRPVEIVGLYEEQRDRMEVVVRSLVYSPLTDGHVSQLFIHPCSHAISYITGFYSMHSLGQLR